MSKRRAQAGAAGSLLALIAVFILLYLLLIPPDLRDQLLNDGTTTSDGKNPQTDNPALLKMNKTVLVESPGRIDYLKFKDYDHPLPAINLYTTTNSNEQDIGDSVYVKNGIFDKKTANITFLLDDPDNTDNIYLSFSVNPNRNNNGRLMIYLNSQLIYDKIAGDSLNAPISIKSKLGKVNTLSFEVTGVGYMFWTTNEYELDDIKLFYDKTDISTQTSNNVFMVTDTEKFNLNKATFEFAPDCNPKTAGKLDAYVNRELVFSSVPDCGQLNRVELSPSVISAGTNKVSFETEGGNYLIDQINVNTEMKQMTYPTYYFDLNKALFSTTLDNNNDEDHNCGDIDGVCPKGCDADLDKDCCLQTTSNYWCDYQPANQDDRCRAVTSESICKLCPSGYEDLSGDPPKKCEDLCGDDTDNKCPDGCSRYYDQDCCYDESPDNFWCPDIPKYGLATCKDAITLDECDACYAGWESDESNFECPTSGNGDQSVLRSGYDIKMTLKFIDDKEQKAGKVYVNGYQFNFNTYSDEYSRNLDMYVEDGTNSIKLEPDQTTLDIRQLVIEIK